MCLQLFTVNSRWEIQVRSYVRAPYTVTSGVFLFLRNVNPIKCKPFMAKPVGEIGTDGSNRNLKNVLKRCTGSTIEGLQSRNPTLMLRHSQSRVASCYRLPRKAVTPSVSGIGLEVEHGFLSTVTFLLGTNWLQVRESAWP